MLPNCTATFFSLSLTPMTTTTATTTTAAAAAAAAATAPAAFFNIIITHLLHSHIHCDLDHSCSKLTPNDLHFFINPRSLHFPPPREISLLHIHTVGNTASFQISRHFFKPTAGGEGGHVTAEVEGVILFLRKSLPPLGWTPPLYYSRTKMH